MSRLRELLRGRFSRFDVILIIELVVSIGLIAQESWLRVNGYGDLPAGLWTFCGLVFGGEIAFFTVYQVSKEVKRPNGTEEEEPIPKYFQGKHGLVRDLEENK